MTMLAAVGYLFLGALAAVLTRVLVLIASAPAGHRGPAADPAPPQAVPRPRPPIVIRRRSIVAARKVCVLKPITPGAPMGLMLGDEDGSVLVRFDTYERALGVAVALEAEARDLLGLLAEQLDAPAAEGAPGWAPLRSVPTQGPDG